MYIMNTEEKLGLYLDEIEPYIDEQKTFVQGEVLPFKRK